ncbi:MAG TPA: hypothetical protein VF194_01730 [Ferrovibrio sp.]|jgi:hypothetical protein|uniref:hypothetical protein n=1 Tax=Ferrovibrio sp. TaxID=1917215 RepID=UPI002ED63C13
MAQRGDEAEDRAELRQGHAWPTTTGELTEGERLVVWAFRRWVSGPEHLPMLAREFDRQFLRQEARPALFALDAALTGLSRHARRSIVYHQPCCACVGADEVCLVCIVAAQQAGATTAARAMAGWLVLPSGLDAFLTPLNAFGERLASSGHDLPYRVGQRNRPVPFVAMPVALSVH